MPRRQLLILIPLVILTGCITHHWTAKAASGRVLDADSGKPVAGVSVFRVSDGKSVLLTTTDSAGRFSVEAAGRHYFEVPLGDPVHLASLVFRAPGYQEQEIHCNTITGEVVDRKAPSLGTVTVKLHKRPNQALQPTGESRKSEWGGS